MHIQIIAEAGVNHNGSFDTAVQMADAAKAAEADFVKFQTFRPEALTSKYAQKAHYQKETTGAQESQLDMLKRLMLPDQAFRELKGHCDKIGIGFLSTPFDLESIALLNTFHMPFWKVPSGEVTNLPYLQAIAQTKRPVVMSTGMCDMDEIGAALKVLREYGAPKITLLQCNTEYPTPYRDVNLRAMQTMRDAFGVETGYSDHTKGIMVPIAAAALGATVIEKHFTLDRDMEGPDQKSSLELPELAEMIRSIRIIEQSLGDGAKRPSLSEAGNRVVARKSIVAARPIEKGQVLIGEMLAAKRPGDGISPMRWQEVLGKKADRDYQPDEPISPGIL